MLATLAGLGRGLWLLPGRRGHLRLRREARKGDGHLSTAPFSPTVTTLESLPQVCPFSVPYLLHVVDKAGQPSVPRKGRRAMSAPGTRRPGNMSIDLGQLTCLEIQKSNQQNVDKKSP